MQGSEAGGLFYFKQHSRRDRLMGVQIGPCMDDAVANGRRLGESRLVKQGCNLSHRVADRAEILGIRFGRQSFTLAVAISVEVKLGFGRSNAARLTFVQLGQLFAIRNIDGKFNR